MQAEAASAVARYWQHAALGVTVLVSLVAAVHALLYKRDSRAAALWVGFIALTPLVGATLYFILGINRVKRRAVFLRGGSTAAEEPEVVHGDDELARLLPARGIHLEDLVHTVSRVMRRPLLGGNCVVPLVNGDEAYPAMLRAIDAAQRSVSLATYIMDRDEAGLAFAAALGRAVGRGVAVRVLIDATGTRYSWPSILHTLTHHKVPHARFLPAFPLHLVSVNLRNHRKLLVVDGRQGFTGGLNIRVGHWLEKKPAHPTQDLHFQVEGPVVEHLQEAFAEDWSFTTRERLEGENWFPPLARTGDVSARGITDGPDEDFERLRWTILAALTTARESVRVATPYFLPDPAMISALSLAAMRGVAVRILVPDRSNLRFVDWASRASWWQLLEHGCRFWASAPPFDHTKLFIVDDCWSLVGSTNWDPRSLRLNFEFNLECYDVALARRLSGLFDSRLAVAREVTLKDVDSRGFALRLRDGIARLFTPFL